jgi:hypothetical protein
LTAKCGIPRWSLAIRGNLMNKDQLFVERRPRGDRAVRRPNSQRASDVLPTQADAIERARKLNPDTPQLVERVRYTSRGKPDQWRKP